MPKCLRRRRIYPENADSVLPCTQGRVGGEGGRGRASNTWFTAHAVMVESQGLGHECRLKNTVSLSSVHDSVNDATSDMGRLDMRQKN